MFKRTIAVTGSLGLAATVLTLGCNKTPTSPGPPPPLSTPSPIAPAPQPRTLSVVSGWDQAVVAGAQVRVNDTALTTDGQGQFVSSETVPADAAIDVDAPGFLPHRTRLSSVPATNVIALWPAASDAEAAAIQSLAFYAGPATAGEYRLWRFSWRAYYLALVTTGDPRSPSEIANEWTREYEEIAALTGLPLSISSSPRGDNDEFNEEVVVFFDGADESCRDPWGFCSFWNSSLPYFSRPVRIAPGLATRREVIQRILVSGLLRSNPLPGLLHRSTPAPNLSLLEQQTLRMQALRPPGTRWPDTAPSR